MRVLRGIGVGMRVVETRSLVVLTLLADVASCHAFISFVLQGRMLTDGLAPAGFPVDIVVDEKLDVCEIVFVRNIVKRMVDWPKENQENFCAHWRGRIEAEVEFTCINT